ncbi:hypothetical protein EJ02DRAFT_357064 [Clathrospora elynae]|uniref:Uncharacterized protein n=1 Tax=Clathrospora elynae TaxID=706981 RepID=A0A6A5S9H6_9PLEO|nr:hypothetical protein EJ02DRAFT_357064 [Clathrospora elynae]
MGFKRKRSGEDSPLSISGYGAVSTHEAQMPTSCSRHDEGLVHVAMDTSSRSTGWDFSSASRVKSSDWGNRTRKRFRDNRPDMRAIHENTLNKLFAAQRNHPEASPIPSDTLPLQHPSQAIAKPQKSNLHSFWKQLPTPPVQSLAFSLPVHVTQAASQRPRCDDCDNSLQCASDGMDVDMDADMGRAVEGSPFACNDCGKNVCGTCAVVSMTRHCLQCATTGRNSRRWW